MNFAWKICLCMLAVMAAMFSTGSYLLIHTVFDSSLERDMQAAVEDSVMIRFIYTTSASSLPEEDPITDTVIRQIFGSMDQGIEAGKNMIVCDETGALLYSNTDLPAAPHLFAQVQQDACLQQITVPAEMENIYIQTVFRIDLPDRPIYVQSFRDITTLYAQRDSWMQAYWNLSAIVLPLAAVLVFGLTVWLTRPIKQLSRAARRVAQGNFNNRISPVSRDELGQLTQDFNTMSRMLALKIQDMERLIQQREDFVASFAHELKTPLTSIIGYADLLRSLQMDPDARFEAANFIFREGKRLEALSLKLLDMIVMQRQDFTMRPVQTQYLLESTAAVLQGPMQEAGIQLRVEVEPAVVWVEPDLIKTLLINLVDNARKASEAGQLVCLTGRLEEERYCICVRDNGRGIPAGELSRITEAFYMVDKSRSRAQNGAGLGLAICQQIAQLHDSRLEFESQEGKGTSVQLWIRGGTDETLA